MSQPNVFAPTFKPTVTPPPQGGGSAASGNLFSPKSKITIKQVGTPTPTPKPSPQEIDQQAQAYAQQQAIHRAAVENAGTISTHGILSPVASRAAAAHQVVNVESAVPIPHYTDTKRYTPHFTGEPIAGYEPIAPAGANDTSRINYRPYYTDAHTAKAMPKGGTALQSALGSTNDQPTLQQVYKDNHPLGQAVIAGLASSIPGVATAKKLAAGESPTAGTVGTEAMNILGFAGGGEIDALKAGIGALRAGKSISEAVQVTRDAARASRAARVSSILQDEHVDPRVKEAVAGAHAAPNPDAFIQKDNPLLDTIAAAQGKPIKPVVEPTTPAPEPPVDMTQAPWYGKKPGESFTFKGPSGTQEGFLDPKGVPRNADGQELFSKWHSYPDEKIKPALQRAAASGEYSYEGPLAHHDLTDLYPEDTTGEAVPHGEEPAPALSTAEQVQQGLRGARAARKQQDAGYSAERAARFARAEAIMHDTSLDPIERHIQAKAQLRGELPKINWNGFTELDENALSEMVRTIQEDPHLLAGQRIRAADALQGAVNGKVPTPSELTLIEHIFGKAEVANGLREISVHPLRGALMSILNIPRSIMSSADLSAPFRQGIVAGARHPAMFAKNFGPMLKAMKSPEYHAATESLIKNDPDYPRALAGGLRLTDFENVREERFPSNAAEKLNLRSIPGPLKGKKYATGPGDVVAASGRAYVTFLNKMRMDMFKYHLRMARERDAAIVDNPKFLSDLSEVINSATGAGGGGKKFEASAAALNTFLFSPRLLKSRLNFLNPFWYKGLDRYARRLAMRSFFQFGAEATAFVGMLSLVPGVKIVTDPRNPDWGKVKVGNTRFDVGGGFQQPIRLAAQIWTAVAISSTTGRKLSLTAGGFGKPTRLDLFIRFFEGKESPIASLVTDKLRGTNQVGQPFKWSSALYQRTVPLLAQDAYDLYNSKQGGVNGIAAAAAGYGIGTFGFGIQTYGPTPPGQKAVSQLQKDAKAAGFGVVPHEFLIDLGHMKGLDTISAQNPKNPNAKLQAAIAYYTKETGDTSYNALLDQKLPDATAENYYLSIRHVMVGPGLAQYEANVKRVLDAEKAAK